MYSILLFTKVDTINLLLICNLFQSTLICSNKNKCVYIYCLDDYETARQNLGLAEVTSDFPSEAEITSKQVHKRNKKYYTDSSESNKDNVKSKKYSVPICKSFSQKQFQKNCKPKSTFVLNLSDSEENEISQSTAKDHGSFELQIPKRLQGKSKQIMNTVFAPKSKKDAAIRSLSSLNIYSDQYKEGIIFWFLLFRISSSSVIHNGI